MFKSCNLLGIRLVGARYRLAFIPKALETRQTRQNLASMGWRRVANAYAIRFLGPFHDLPDGRGLNQLWLNPSYRFF